MSPLLWALVGFGAAVALFVAFIFSTYFRVQRSARAIARAEESHARVVRAANAFQREHDARRLSR